MNDYPENHSFNDLRNAISEMASLVRLKEGRLLPDSKQKRERINKVKEVFLSSLDEPPF